VYTEAVWIPGAFTEDTVCARHCSKHPLMLSIFVLVTILGSNSLHFQLQVRKVKFRELGEVTRVSK
jgi:hypothetical protein